jgi:hypothetical protein
MTSYNAANERMKRHYFAYLADAQGHNEQTIDSVAKAIARFEAYTRYKDFKTFHIEQAKAFKRDLADQRGHRSGEPLSKPTLYATLTALKRFFVWLAGQPGYKSRIPIRMPSTSIFRLRRRGSPKPPAPRAFRPWSKYAMSSYPCPRPPISRGAIAR